jgi:SAM-dependent methyltransferase
MPDFSLRTLTPELMDTEPADYETFRACLVDLAIVNRLTLAYRPTLVFFQRLLAEGRWPVGEPLRVLDIGSGYGDPLRVLARWAERRGLYIDITGADLNPFATRAAEAATPPGAPIRWRTADALTLDGPRPDVVTSSLFAHHLGDDDLVRFIAWSEKTARVGWLVNDLRRSRLSYHGFSLLSRAMAWHRFVQHDGPVSIARAFTDEDWKGVLSAAGVPRGGARVVRRFPFRLCVERMRA